MAAYIVIAIIAYLIGSINFSVIISKRMAGFDVREKGSGNAGTTNMLRSVGIKAAVITLLCDILKGVVVILIAILIGNIIDNVDSALLVQLAGIFVIIGHTFPIFFQFKGGKGIAASVGLLLAFDWRIFLICAVVFFALFFATHYVSLCSLAGYLCFVVLLFAFGQTGMYPCSQPVLYEMYVIAFLLMVLAYWRHRQNIGRLLHGNENKIFLSKKR